METLKKSRIEIRHGHPMGETATFFTVVILVIGFSTFTLVKIHLLFVLAPITLLTVGIAIALMNSGIEILPSKDKFIVYTSGISGRKGEWRKLSAYPFLTVLGIRNSAGFSPRGSGATVKYFETKYEIYLLRPDHSGRILVKGGYGNKPDALKFAEELGAVLNKEVVVYSPSSRRRK